MDAATARRQPPSPFVHHQKVFGHYTVVLQAHGTTHGLPMGSQMPRESKQNLSIFSVRTIVTDRIHTVIKNDQRTSTGKEKSIEQPNVTALQWHVFSAKTIATDRTRRTNGEQDQKVILSY